MVDDPNRLRARLLLHDQDRWNGGDRHDQQDEDRHAERRDQVRRPLHGREELAPGDDGVLDLHAAPFRTTFTKITSREMSVDSNISVIEFHAVHTARKTLSQELEEIIRLLLSPKAC